MLGVDHELQVRDLLLEKGDLLLKTLGTGEAKGESKDFTNASYSCVFLFICFVFYCCFARFSSHATCYLLGIM